MADTTPVNDKSNNAPAAQPQQADLFTRLSNYTVVNSVVQQYNNLKSVSPILKAGLETAEGTTSKIVGFAQPVVAPVITKLDNALHLEQAANKVLDKTEAIAEKAVTAYQTGVAQSHTIANQTVESAKTIVQLSRDVVAHNVETAKEKVATTYAQGTDLVNQTIARSVDTGSRLVTDYANKPVNHILDYTEAVVNSILPPELELEPIDIHEDVPKDAAQTPEKTETEKPATAAVSETPSSSTSLTEHLEANPLPRIMNFGGGVGKRVKRVALSKLQNLSFRSQAEVNSMSYVVDLIQYTADYIDLDQKRQAVTNATENIQHFFEEKKEQTAKFVHPVKEIVEKQTQDLKEQGVKSVVAIVSTIAHTTEVVRRQFIGQVPDVQQLQQNLAQITERTKNLVTSLPEPHLSQYLAYVRSTYHNALEALVTLTSAYSPASLSSAFPLLHSIDGQLQSWRNSLFSRLSYTHPISSTSTSSTTTSTAPSSTTEVSPSTPLTPIKPSTLAPVDAPVTPQQPKAEDKPSS